MKNDINLRKEMDEILKDYGYYVLLQRSSRKIRCGCWSERWQEANTRCMICLGSGWVSQVERHQTFFQNQTQIVSKPDLSEVTPFGRMYSPANEFWFRHDTHPQVGDLVFEVGWKGQKPANLIRAYRINHVEAKRGDNGRIEYYMVATKGEPMDFDVKDFIVRQVGPIKNYEMVR